MDASQTLGADIHPGKSFIHINFFLKTKTLPGRVRLKDPSTQEADLEFEARLVNIVIGQSTLHRETLSRKTNLKKIELLN